MDVNNAHTDTESANFLLLHPQHCNHDMLRMRKKNQLYRRQTCQFDSATMPLKKSGHHCLPAQLLMNR